MSLFQVYRLKFRPYGIALTTDKPRPPQPATAFNNESYQPFGVKNPSQSHINATATCTSQGHQANQEQENDKQLNNTDSANDKAEDNEYDKVKDLRNPSLAEIKRKGDVYSITGLSVEGEVSFERSSNKKKGSLSRQEAVSENELVESFCTTVKGIMVMEVAVSSPFGGCCIVEVSISGYFIYFFVYTRSLYLIMILTEKK